MTALFQLLQSSPLAFTILAGVLGLMVGSFLNVVIHRLPKMMELGWRQQCAELLQSENTGNQTPARR
jgi:leader peptidase (prepilin peptidase)/N-methyltransferase